MIIDIERNHFAFAYTLSILYMVAAIFYEEYLFHDRVGEFGKVNTILSTP